MSAVIVQEANKIFGKQTAMPLWMRSLRSPVETAKANEQETLTASLLAEQGRKRSTEMAMARHTRLGRNPRPNIGSRNTPERSWLMKKRYLSHE